VDKQRLQELAGVQLEESKAYFITDFGKSITGTDASGKKKIVIDRFGVWGDTGAGKPQVIDTGDNLESLKKKHGDLKVKIIGKVTEDVQLDEVQRVPTDLTEKMRERLVEVLDLAHDTLSRREEVTDKTIEFTLNALEEVMNLLDPSNLR